MSFRLFGVPVTVRWFFWLGALILGLAGSGPVWAMPFWIGAVFVSILVHELGHAFAARRHGVAPSITLHALGGVTVYPPFRGTRLDRAVVSLAGPLAGLVLGGAVYLLQVYVLPQPLPLVASVAVAYLLWINIAWSLFNLVPVLPFDGGHVMEEALGPRRARTAALVSLIVAIALALVCALFQQTWGAMLFAVSAIQSYQRYTLPEGAVLVDPLTAPATASQGADPLRRAWLRFRLRGLQKQAEQMEREERGERPRRREGGPDLRVIRGGADRPKDKRDLN